jgi:hypothetical protein
VMIYGGERCHILATSQTIEEVLAGFDINLHAAAVPALDDGRESAWHPDYSRYVLRILGWRDPKQTLMRAFKFGERYGVHMAHDVFYDQKAVECAAEAFGWSQYEVGDGL